MAQTIQLKRSSVAGNIPGTSDLALGEIAINTADGAVYIKTGNDDIVAVADDGILHIDTTNSRVGIATTTPDKKLDVVGDGSFSGVDNLLYLQAAATGTPTLRFEQGTTRRAFIRYQNANSNFDIINEYGGVTIWTGTSGSESQKLIVDSSGNVGIGGATPNQRLVIADTTGETTLAINNATTTVGNLSRLDFRHNGITGSQIKSGAIEDFTTTANRTSDLRFFTRNNGTIAERLRIKEDGNVGIGTDSPTRLLDIRKTTIGDIASFRGSDGARELVISSSTTTSIGDTYTLNANSSNGVVAIATSSSERLRITNTGNVGIGTSDPGYRLDLGGTTASTSNTLRLNQNNGGTAIRIGAGSGDSDVVIWRIDGAGAANAGATDAGNYGFSLKYFGSGTGNENRLKLLADNQANATQNVVWESNQTGTITFQQNVILSSTTNLKYNTDTILDTSKNLSNIANISHSGGFTQNAGSTVNSTYVYSTNTSGQPGFVAANNTSGNEDRSLLMKYYGTAVSTTIFGQNVGGKVIVAASGSANGGLLLGSGNSATNAPVYMGTGGNLALTIDTSQNVTLENNLIFDDGQITSDGTNFIFDGASGKEVIISSARDVRIIIDDNNDDTNNEFQIFKHSSGSASNKILNLTQAGALTINEAYTFPTADGSANQVLQTDGSGNLSFADVSGGGGVTISNNADNRVLTGDGTNANAEANLTFDGSTLDVTGGITGSGNVAIDTDTFVVSASNDRVGINVGTPLATLDIDGDVYVRTGHTLFTDILRPYATATLTIGQGTNDIAKFTGSIKIGNTTIVDSSRNLTNIGTISASTATFSTALDASITVQSTDAITGIVFTDNGGTGHLYYVGGSDKFYTDGKLAVNGSTLSGGMDFQVNGNSNFAGTITSNGDMAIDTDTLFVDVSTDRVGINAGTAPSYSLHVSGDIYSSDTVQTKEFQNIKLGDASTPANTAGWFKIARVDRGTGRIFLSFTGGNYSPTTYEILYFKNWSTLADLQLNQHGTATHITSARIRQDSSDSIYYVEIYCASDANGKSFQVYHKQLDGYFDGDNTAYTGSLTAGSASGTTYREADFVPRGRYFTKLEADDIELVGSTPTLSIPAHSGIEIDITGSASSGNIRANTDLYLLSQTAGLHLGAGGTNGVLSINSSGNTSFTGDVSIADSQRLKIGNATNGDLSFIHDGTNTYIQNTTGNLDISNTQDDGDIYFKSDDGSGGMAEYFRLDGSLTKTYFEQNVQFNDNVKLQLGAGADLAIHHDGSHSFIRDVGTGSLYLDSSGLIARNASNNANMIVANASGAVTLYHDGSSKLATKSDGVDITGELQSDSLDVDGAADISGAITTGGVLKVSMAQSSGSPILDLHNSTNAANVEIRFTDVALGTSQFGHIRYNHADSNSYGSGASFTIGSDQTTTTILANGKLMFDEGLYLKPTSGTGAGTEIIDSSGNLSNIGTISSGAITSTGSSQVANLTVTGNLTVQGTTTTLETATLNVEDKNITLNYSSGDSSGSANGAGITIQDAVNSSTDATILWDSTNDEFDFSHSIKVAGSIGVTNIVTNKVVKYNGSTLDDSNITDTGSVITLGSNTTVSGNVTHSGLTMTSGTDIDQLTTTTVTATLSTSWQDTGINATDLASGTYIISVFVDDHSVGGNHYDELYSGVMSWHSGSTNSTKTDEILLHRAGHAPNSGDFFLRTERHPSGGDNLMLQMRGSTSNSGNSDYIFKFRRMI